MADINVIVGGTGDDPLQAEPGANDITGGPGNDIILATDGLNTIHYQLGDGVDTVKFALPRTYQYARFLTEATSALANQSNFRDFVTTANTSLINALPFDISSVLNDMRRGPVDSGRANAALTQLIAWINAPVGNVIQFGPGIKLSDVAVQLGQTATFGAEQSTPVQFAVALNSEQGMVFGLADPQVVARDVGAPVLPPTIDMTFQFADGTSATLADLLARPGVGVIGDQMGSDGNDFLHGSLSDDTLFGNDGDDKLDGGAGTDHLFGGAGDDVISGGSGNDNVIYGEDGNDVMAVGKGERNFMYGGAGDDVYCFNRGDGSVTIDDQDWSGNGVDTISFGNGVTLSDVVASVDPSSGNLMLSIAGTSDVITIPWFDAGNGMTARTDSAIERVQFFDADGTAHVYDLGSLVNAAFPDPSTADPAVSVVLVDPGSTSSLSEVGQPYARSYALTGNLFPPENNAPTLGQAIGHQSATQGVDFAFQVPADAFVDIDNDKLSYSAKLKDGSDLPSWLTLNSSTGEFSGKPSNADVVDMLSIEVTASDGSASVSQEFSLNVANVNDAPTVANSIPNQSATQGVAFSYTVPGNTFADIDVGDTLTYSAKLADGSALPSWLKFDSASGKLSGTPANADVGALSIQLTATDTSGASSAPSLFALNVANVNDAPTVANSIPNQSATQGVAFSYTVPGNTFADIDVGDTLTYSAKLADGSALPSWLKFDSASGKLSGTPANADVGALSIQLTATDTSGASSAPSLFALNVANVNDAPTVANSIPNQSATQGVAFSYTVPGNTFADIDVGDTLTYSAKLADGSALPSWLKFDSASGKLSGTPANADVGALSIQLTATDTSGASSAPSLFALNVANVNDAPTVANSIPNQSATQGVAFSYTVPGNTFADIDVGDTLTYSAKLADGSALPSWLKFDSASGKLSGTPANADVGALSIQLTATDTSGASSAPSLFALNVANVNDAPTVANSIPNQSATQGVAFSYTVPGNTFADIDVGDTLTYSAKLADGSALPSWLKFDSTTRTLSGTPPAPAPTGTPGSAPQWEIQVVATDMSGASASDMFTLIDPPPPVGPSPVPVPPPANGRTITGTRHNDRLYGTSGDDSIIGGKGNDLLSGKGGNDVLRGGSGDDRLDGAAGNDDLEGGSGNDKLKGGSGADLLQGGNGNDQLSDTSGNGLQDGGSGNDTLTEGSGNSMLVGGKGNDHLYLGGGYDIIAFNRGDGRDVVSSGKGGSVTLSLGGGIRYQDLSLLRSGNDLILETGSNERITFEKWYAGKRYQAVSKLQVVAEAMPGFDPSGGNTMLDDKVESFDFKGLVAAFDNARRYQPGLSRWTLTNALAQFQLGDGSDSKALGGDLAYQYGVNGTLAGIAVNAAQGTVGSSQFGKEAQTLHSQSELKDGLVKLS